jgi:hypothetical protein
LCKHIFSEFLHFPQNQSYLIHFQRLFSFLRLQKYFSISVISPMSSNTITRPTRVGCFAYVYFSLPRMVSRLSSLLISRPESGPALAQKLSRFPSVYGSKSPGGTQYFLLIIGNVTSFPALLGNSPGDLLIYMYNRKSVLLVGQGSCPVPKWVTLSPGFRQ